MWWFTHFEKLNNRGGLNKHGGQILDDLKEAKTPINQKIFQFCKKIQFFQ